MNIQVTCDVNGEITLTSVTAKWPRGVFTVHDARIWRNSAVNTLLSTGIAGNKLLIGDSKYPISTYLCKPYPQSEANTNPVKKNFNSILSEERIVIEHVFGQLKSRFQMLRTLLRIAITLVPKFIVACCVLHNVGKYLNDPFADDEKDEKDDDEDDNIEPTQSATNMRRAGQARRDAIADLLRNTVSRRVLAIANPYQ